MFRLLGPERINPAVRLVEFYLRSRLLRAIALIYVVGATWITCFGVPSETRLPPYRIDVDVYRLGGLAVAAHEPLYGQDYLTEIGANLPFTYPPIAGQFFAVLLAPVSLSYATAAIAVASAVALFAVVWLVLREMTTFRGSELVWATVGVMVFAVPLVPFQSTISFGQINVFLMLLVVVDLTVGRNRWWRGAFIGFAAAIKLTPLAFGLYFLMRRDFRGGVQTLLAFGLWTAVGHLRSPQNSTIYWTETLSNSGRIGSPDYASNQSISGLLARTNLSEGAQGTVWFIAVVVLGILTAAIMWLLIRHGHHLAAVLANAFFGLLASPISWSHHWVWAIPALMWLVVQIRPSKGPSPDAGESGSAAVLKVVRPPWLPWLLAAVAVWGWLVFFYGPQFLLPNGDGQERNWTVVQDALGNMWIWWTLVFIAALALVALLDRPEHDSGPVFVQQLPRALRNRLRRPSEHDNSGGDGAKPHATAPADAS